MVNNNRIKKYSEYIKEDIENENEVEGNDYVSNDNPESYIESKLTTIRNKVESMFSDESDHDQKSSESEESISFKDLGVKLESIEMSNVTKTHRNLIIKFSDENYYYSLLFRIDLKQISNQDDTKEMDLEDIKKCFVKFKKYKVEGFELLGEITDNADIKNIDENYLINLKIELDDKFDDDSEDLSIEYED